MTRPIAASALLLGLTLLVARPATARDFELPDVTYPALPRQAASAEGFVPQGWKIESRAAGDLNADGVADLALVLRETNPKNIITHDGLGPSPFDSNPRILAAAFGAKGGGYALAAENHTFIPRPETPTLSDPYEGELTIRRGTLKVGLNLFANAGGWTMFNSTFTFRFQGGRFTLIGFDRNTVQRNSGASETVSVNYSTRKARIAVGTIESDGEKAAWKTLPPGPAPTLDDIGDGLAFEPKY